MKYVKYDKDIQEIGTEVMIISSEMANDINKIQELEGNWFFKIIKMTSGPTENDNNYCITGTCLKNIRYLSKQYIEQQVKKNDVESSK